MTQSSPSCLTSTGVAAAPSLTNSVVDARAHRHQHAPAINGMNPVLLVRNLIETAKLNGIDPQSWLTDVLNRIADHKIKRIISFLIQKFLPGVGA